MSVRVNSGCWAAVACDRIQFFGDAADAVRCASVAAGKGNGSKHRGFVRHRGILCHPPACRRSQRPGDVDAAGEHAQEVGIVQCDVDQHVVGQD